MTQSDSAPLNVLFKRPRTYLLEHQRFLRDVMLQWSTKDTRPELLNKSHIIQVNLFPGIVLGHAKLGPVWKDNAFVFWVERFSTWMITGSFTTWRLITRSLDMTL